MEERHKHRGWFVTSGEETIVPGEQYSIDYGLGNIGTCVCDRQIDWQGKG